MKRRILFAQLLAFLLLAASLTLFAQQTQTAGSEVLTLDSIFTYRTKSLGPVQWQKDGTGYMALEPAADKARVRRDHSLRRRNR